MTARPQVSWCAAGSPPAPACDICFPNPSVEPRYFSCGFSDCGYNNASLVLTSLNGFSATVTCRC